MVHIAFGLMHTVFSLIELVSKRSSLDSAGPQHYWHHWWQDRIYSGMLFQ